MNGEEKDTFGLDASISDRVAAGRKILKRNVDTAKLDNERERLKLEKMRAQSQKCQVIVSYPGMRIEGRRVILGEPLIMLPDCRRVTIEELQDIELGRSN